MAFIKKKGQASMEFMIIIGFMLTILIPLSILYYQHVSNMNTDVKAEQLQKVANEIVDKAEEVYYLGSPSKITIKAYIPNDVKDIKIGSNEINFKLKTSSGISDIFAVSKVNITGSIENKEGIRTITIQAEDNNVRITG